MKTRAIILLILTAHTSLFAQIANFEAYQKAIHEAELNIVTDNQEKALNIYYDLLTTSDGNFANDIYNALILADGLNKRDTLFALFELVKRKNFDTEYLLGLSEFEHLHSDPRWKAFISTNNEVIYIDTLLRQKVKQLYTRDTLFRVREGSYKVYGDTIRKLDSLNMVFLFARIASQGLPGEKEIGAENFRSDQGYDIVIHHYCQTYSQGSEMRASYGTAPRGQLIIMTDILIKEAVKGRVKPNKCAQWLEYQNVGFNAGTFDLCRYSYGGVVSKLLAPPYTADQRLLIDNARKRLYLEPIEDYHKKAAYMARQPESKFAFDIRMNILEWANEEDFIAGQKYLIPLE